VPLPKCRRSPWEQTPLAFECPNYEGKKETQKCTKIASSSWAFWARTRKANPQRRRGGRSLSLATKTWWTGTDEQRHEKTEWHRIIVWNGLADYAADKLKKGDHLYVVGTLVSNVYEKEVGKGKTKAKAQITAWQIKAFSIRKLDRKESVPTTPATQAQAQSAAEPF
jgi:single-stranded DNA-binding protein